MHQTLESACNSELLIRKSRFLACVEPVADRKAALRIIHDLRKAHPTATHVCWALMAGGDSAAVDDGEPSGTAGRPMLEVLRHQQLEGVLASVVRYYGGINLGAGGLVRAYTDAVAQALLKARKVPIVPLQSVICTLPYGMEGLVLNRIDQVGITQLEVVRTLEIQMHLEGPVNRIADLKGLLREPGQGKIAWSDECS